MSNKATVRLVARWINSSLNKEERQKISDYIHWSGENDAEETGSEEHAIIAQTLLGELNL